MALVIIAGVFIFAKIIYAESITNNVVINQIMTGDCTEAKNEFIELFNNSEVEIILDGYKLTKKTRSGAESNLISSSKFKGIVPAKGYFLISTSEYVPTIKADSVYSGTTYSIASENTIILYDKENEIIDKVGYGDVSDFESKPTIDPPSGKSIKRKEARDTNNNFDDFVLSDPTAHNSKSEITSSEIISSSCSSSLKDSGAENISIKNDKNIYKNMYAAFEVSYSGATPATKYTWNFGDGHKSYLQKTTHKYEEAGTYMASVTIRGDKSAKKNFEVEVEEYEAPKIRIISLSPNPKGKDSKNEWVEIRNDSKKKIDLKDWVIATGWEKLINHKITKKFTIKPQKSAKLTSKFCAFTLNNIKNKIELRDPTGETAQKLKYNRKKDKIEDDEIFELNGKDWNWVASQNDTKDEQNNTEESNNPPAETNTPAVDEEINIVSPEEIQANVGKFTPDSLWERRKESRIKLISYGTTVSVPVDLSGNQGRVLGLATEKFSTPEKHWAIYFLDIMWIKINYTVNRVLWY